MDVRVLRCKDDALCPFEQLPTEILEEICILSGNINLVRASPSLFSCLASRHVKEALIESLFHWESANSENLGRPKNPEDPTMNIPRLAMLRTRWCTPELICKTKARLFVSAAVTLLKQALRKEKTNADKAVDNLTACLFRPAPPEDYLRCFHCHASTDVDVKMRWEHATITWGVYGYWQYDDRHQCSHRIKIGWSEDYYQNSTIEEARCLHPTGWNDTWCSQWDDLHQYHELRMPDTRGLDRFPSHLLQGPFTQAKGDFLERLMDERRPTRMDHESIEERSFLTQADPSALDPGFEDALRESCVPAILFLMNPRSRGGMNPLGKLHWNYTGKQGCFEGTCMEQLRDWAPGQQADQPWTIAGQAIHLFSPCHVINVQLRHFELLFDRSGNPKIQRLGILGYGLLLVLLAREAYLKGSCKRRDVMERLRKAKRRGAEKAKWGPWAFVRDGIKFMDVVWEAVGHWAIDTRRYDGEGFDRQHVQEEDNRLCKRLERFNQPGERAEYCGLWSLAR